MAVAEDLPAHGLQQGDLVTIVDFLAANNHHPAGYVVEIFSVTGETLDVVSLAEHQLMPLRADAIPTMREFATAA